LVGEASPEYLLHPLAAERTFATIPHGKFVVSLRNPVDRAYSHHNVSRARGYEPLTFEEAIDNEESRLTGEVDRLVEDPKYEGFKYFRYSYLLRGHYADQLQGWFGIFPREQFLIIQAEDFFAEPANVMKEVTDFLGVPALESMEYHRYNPGDYASTMKPETKRYLVEYFRPHNQRLYEILEQDFSWDQ
jgi:hypothetical protein